MKIPDPATLRKAIAIKMEIEKLEEQLHKLFTSASPQDSVVVSKMLEKPVQEISDEVRHGFEKKEVEKKTTQHDSLTRENADDVAQQKEHGENKVAPHEVIAIPASTETHQETLLLVDDSGEEQLALTPHEEICEFHPQASSQEHCSLFSSAESDHSH